MANLTFPQLTSGALAQYPIRKVALIRSIKNSMQDGSMLVAQDLGSSSLLWQMAYIELSPADIGALQSHFSACAGPLRAFTFIDPTDNILAFSADFTASVWTLGPTVTVQNSVIDPLGGQRAFTLTNTGQVAVEISQQASIPANFQYCFSVYASATSPTMINLARRGPSDSQQSVNTVNTTWQRLISSGRLNDSGPGFTVSVGLAPGQSVSLFGPQLEAQISPSRYRATYQAGGVYPNAHWAVQELMVTAEGPNLFSTSFSIETNVGN